MDGSAKLLVVVNHAAARARRAWPVVGEALARNGVAFDSHATRHAGDAQERTRAALLQGYTTVAAVGGDGTLSEAASGFFESCGEPEDGAAPRPVNPSAALAVLPAGTGDDFARGLCGGRREPLDAWVRRLVAHCRRGDDGTGGATRLVDVLCGSVDGGGRRFVCLNAASFGVGAEACARVATQGGAARRLPGEARFALAALGALGAWRERRVRLRVDAGEWFECRTNIVVVANGPYAGGGMNFAPGARTDDGRLDVLTACGMTRARIVRELARVRGGTHLANPRVHLLRGSRVSVEVVGEGESLRVEADGDLRGRTPAEFRVVPGALRVVW